MNQPSRQDAALKIIAACATKQDDLVSGLIDSFQALLALWGLDAGAGGGWTGIGAKRSYRFYFNTWPADWLAVYNNEGLFLDDPIVPEAMRRMSPFRWADLTDGRTLDERASNVVARVYAYGWADGLVIPVHGPSGYQGMVSLASMRRLDLSHDDIALIWVMSVALHDRCRVTRGLGESSHPAPELSARETECMRWVAAGKTDWEIGLLMSVSSSTAHFHVERVKKRLNTSSRTEAVAMLVLHGAL